MTHACEIMVSAIAWILFSFQKLTKAASRIIFADTWQQQHTVVSTGHKVLPMLTTSEAEGEPVALWVAESEMLCTFLLYCGWETV